MNDSLDMGVILDGARQVIDALQVLEADYRHRLWVEYPWLMFLVPVLGVTGWIKVVKQPARRTRGKRRRR